MTSLHLKAVYNHSYEPEALTFPKFQQWRLFQRPVSKADCATSTARCPGVGVIPVTVSSAERKARTTSAGPHGVSLSVMNLAFMVNSDRRHGRETRRAFLVAGRED